MKPQLNRDLKNELGSHRATLYRVLEDGIHVQTFASLSDALNFSKTSFGGKIIQVDHYDHGILEQLIQMDQPYST